MKKCTFTVSASLPLSLVFCLLCASQFAHAQFAMDVMPNAKPMDPSVIIYGASDLNNGIPYNRIQGSPFWNDEYRLATLFGDNDKEKWRVKTKLNLNTGEVYFLGKNEEELVAPPALVKKIIFTAVKTAPGRRLNSGLILEKRC